MSFTSNIEITKSYPATLYNASEGAADWHEEHEINGQFWLAANATYNESLLPPQWESIDHSHPIFICQGSKYRRID